MKLEVGMYARTKHNGIQKVAGHHDNKIEFITRYGEGFIIVYKKIEDFVVKTSHNLIDLIEVGDYVNGYKVISTPIGLNNKKLLYLDCSNEMLSVIGLDDFKIDIKEILTKEQYNSNKYVIGDDKE